MRERTYLNRVSCHFNLMSCIKNFIHDNAIFIVHSCVFFSYMLCNISLIFEENCLLKRSESFFVNYNHAKTLLRNKILKKTNFLCKPQSYSNFSLTFLCKARVPTFVMLRSSYVPTSVKRRV